ncbi:exoglucanase-6A [Lasiosphaeria hispida]|uniref:Glucanase n=1 Tax=Lasiosphaeria hispida TaxID=260671 RepID=A0AAJ0HCR9_9PEZI|nr:exoglucanase-6A [Lasiosphaeria hispida]
MKASQSLLVLIVGNVAGLPHPGQREPTCQHVSLNVSTNVWKTYSLYPNPVYKAQVLSAAQTIQDPILKKKAFKVAEVGSFLWMCVTWPPSSLRNLYGSSLNSPSRPRNNATAISTIDAFVADVPCDRVIGIVLQGLDTGYCSAPRFRTVEAETYRKEFINPLATLLTSHPSTAFALILEPETLPIMVLNSDLSTCKPLATSYRTNVAYALQTLNLPNVVIYLDAGHGGNLGWESNLAPAASELAAVYSAAGRPSQLRGFAVNIGGWNAWDLSPGEFDTTREAPRNRAQNEMRFVALLGRLLGENGTPNHAVMDTSRNGVPGLRYEWGDWCNVDGAGFGRFPSAEGTGLELADAFIWAKGGGVSDGTSDASAVSYDAFCGKLGAFKPSPEKGEWNQAYFEMLLENAHPYIRVDTIP